MTPHPARLSPFRRPWPTLLAVALGVVTLHLGLWQGLGNAFGATLPSESTQALQVRTVASPIAPALDATPVVAKPAPAARRKSAPAPARALAPAPMAKADPTPPEPQAAADEPVLVAAALPAEAATPVATAAPTASSAPDAVPTYRTQMPPAITLNYRMRRGALSGSGALQWRPTATGYEARLEGHVAGLSILTWLSQGGFDAAGIAPVRYTDQRMGRGVQAANFQRQAGKITFSGPSTEFPLLQGAQDRLSWMIQIAAIASAAPQRMTAGSRWSMYVASAQGDAEVWTFQVQGTEDVTIGDAPSPTIKLLREPRKPHDMRVEVWLAPSVHYLPVRARLSSGDSALELMLRDTEAAP